MQLLGVCGSGTGLDHASRPAPHAVPQEALADPGRKRRGTAPALRGARRRAGIDRRIGGLVAGRQWSIRRRRRATLMRHEVDAAAVGGSGLDGAGLVTHLFATALAPAA